MRDDSLINFSSVVNAIYDETENTNDIDWRPFLSNLLEATNSMYAYMAFGNPKTWTKRTWISVGDLRGIENHLAKHSRLLEQTPFLALPENTVASAREITNINNPVGDIFNSRVLLQYGIADIVGAHFIKQDEQIAHFYLGRSNELGYYAAEQKEFCKQLLPHLHRAWKNSYTIKNKPTWQYELLDILEIFGIEIIFINANREIIDATNNASRSIKKSQDFLSIRNGRLCLALEHEEKYLDATINHALERQNQESSFFLVSDKQHRNKIPILLRCKPKTQNADLSVCIAVYFKNGAPPQPIAPQTLRSMFGLTAAEAKIASGLISGLSMKKIANQGGVSINTAYGQLKATFRKLGVNHQSELVSQILGSLAVLGKR